MLCPIKVDSNTVKLRVHNSCYCVLDLLCVILLFYLLQQRRGIKWTPNPTHPYLASRAFNYKH